MTTMARKTAEVGDLVVAVFDSAANYSADPQEVARLATRAVTAMLRRAQRSSAPVSRPTACARAADMPVWN
jgi:hypothetical protein